MEFPVQATYSLGVLNFLGRHTALILDGSADVSTDDWDVLYGLTRQENEDDYQMVLLKIGIRQYHLVAPKAAGFYQFGVSPEYDYRRSRSHFPSDGQTSENIRRTYSVGAFFGVGGTYFVTPRVTVGMVTNTQLSYHRHRDQNKFTSTGYQSDRKATGRGIGFSVDSPMIVAALYF